MWLSLSLPQTKKTSQANNCKVTLPVCECSEVQDNAAVNCHTRIGEADAKPLHWLDRHATAIVEITVAAACGYYLTRHHHALADAEACAYIAMKIL